jgi:DNA-binding CsgD family transcriptional regulator
MLVRSGPRDQVAEHVLLAVGAVRLPAAGEGAGERPADGWGRPRPWLEAAAGVFGRHGIEALAARCRALLDGPRPSRWSRLGITERQADVLRLVATGISNEEIAARLHLSPRTVEKHVENLLRITAAQSRTQLVAIAGPESD